MKVSFRLLEKGKYAVHRLHGERVGSLWMQRFRWIYVDNDLEEIKAESLSIAKILIRRHYEKIPQTETRMRA